jgi:hypothetical protein
VVPPPVPLEQRSRRTLEKVEFASVCCCGGHRQERDDDVVSPAERSVSPVHTIDSEALDDDRTSLRMPCDSVLELGSRQLRENVNTEFLVVRILLDEVK